jgi:hypothetical protein
MLLTDLLPTMPSRYFLAECFLPLETFGKPEEEEITEAMVSAGERVLIEELRRVWLKAVGRNGRLPVLALGPSAVNEVAILVASFATRRWIAMT